MTDKSTDNLLSDQEIIDIRDSLLPSQGESFDTLAFARAVLAAQAPQAAEPVADVCDAYVLRWVGTGPIAPLIRRNGIKVGDKLYAAPHAPAAQPLTDERRKHLLPSANYIADGYGYTGMQVWAYGKLIEQAHGIGIAPSAQGEAP